MSYIWVLLNPPTTDQQTTDHLPTDPTTHQPPTYWRTDTIIIFKILEYSKIFTLQNTNSRVNVKRYFGLLRSFRKDRRVVHGVTTSDNKWQRVTTSGTTSDNKWQRVTSGTTSDSEWYNKWQEVTVSNTKSDNKKQWVTVSDSSSTTSEKKKAQYISKNGWLPYFQWQKQIHYYFKGQMAAIRVVK